MKIIVAGGAGFIGSHMCDQLLADGHDVLCVDDLSFGLEQNIAHLHGKPHFSFIKQDILDADGLERAFSSFKPDCVFHLAANSDIQSGDAMIDYSRTFLTTFRLLMCMRKHDVRQMVFTSTSAIYGELEGRLDEGAGPLFPISFYGAAKLASEGFITASAENFHIQSWIVRFPNVVGERATHGALFDFINKLRKNPAKLQVLGDGNQEKPYIYVRDLVEGVLFIWKNSHEKVNCFNLGPADATKVSRIAEIAIEELGLAGADISYTGGLRGWTGDVPKFQYNTSKAAKLGFHVKRSSDDAVRLAAKRIISP